MPAGASEDILDLPRVEDLEDFGFIKCALDVAARQHGREVEQRVRATVVQRIPSTSVTSREPSVALVWASMPDRLRPGRRDEITSIAARLVCRRPRRWAAVR
jgi:hypothetical protein